MFYPVDRWYRLVLALALLALFCPAASAQSAGSTTAALNGTVKDTTGAVLPGAQVQIKSPSTGQMREATTDERGEFQLSLVPPGEYDFKVEVEGFNPVSRRILLTLGQTLNLPVEMQIGSATEIVEVSSAAPILEVNKTEVSTTIDRQRIETLPINKRNFLDFSLTTPGVNTDRLPSQGAGASSGISFNGQTPRQNNITIDGLDNNDPGSSSVRSTFSQDAVQEFQVVANSFSAEFGRALGGIVNIVTRSGTNDFHGTAFVYNRNDNLNARNAFATSNPPFSQYQYGFSLGGPIVKDKHFFFVALEHLKIDTTNFVTISDKAIGSLNRLGFPAANGTIPYKVTNTPLLISTRSQLSARDTLSFRYNFSRGKDENLDPWGGLQTRSSGGVGFLRDDAYGVTNTAIINARTILESRFLFARRSQGIEPLDENLGPSLTILADEGTIEAGRGTLLPQPRLEHIYQVFNAVTYTRGRQSVKAGVDLFFAKALKKQTALPIIYGGLAVFVPIDFAAIAGIPILPKFSALETFDPSLRSAFQKAFLNSFFGSVPGIGSAGDLPLPGAFIQGFGDPFDNINTNYVSVFVQDDIKLRPNLTAKIGGRYDREGLDKPFPDSGGNHFSPRIALAYSPLKSDKLNIHLAYGLFYGVTQIGTNFATKIADGVRTKTIVLTLQDPRTAQGAAVNRALIASFAQPGHKYPETGQLPAALAGASFPARIFVPDPNHHTPYAHQASLGFDLLINKDTTFSASYQLVRGLHGLISRNINPVTRPDLGDPAGRPDPTKGDVFSFEGGGDSYYHGVSFSVTRRFSKRFGGLVTYTYSKALDNFLDFFAETEEVVDPQNIKNERGFSVNDVRNRFVASGIFDVGYNRNIFTRDFQLSTIVTANSGRPYNLLAGVDLNRNGDNPPGDRPAGIARNAGITPGLVNVDMRLTRNIRFKERYTVTLTFEGFNIFNRTNISVINRIYPPNADGTFNLPPTEGGRFIATPDRFRGSFPARQFQLGARFAF